MKSSSLGGEVCSGDLEHDEQCYTYDDIYAPGSNLVTNSDLGPSGLLD